MTDNPPKQPVAVLDAKTDEPRVHYDESLLDHSRTQWQYGDWSSLVKLTRETLQHHPDRAKLALLAAAGRLHAGDVSEARLFVRLAQTWGASRKHISQVLVSSIHNTIGRAYLAMDQDKRALKHFEEAIHIVQPDAERRLLAESRAIRESATLGLIPQAARLLECQFKDENHQVTRGHARLKILETEMELLHHELSLAQQRHQLFHRQSNSGLQFSDDADEWLDRLKTMSVSQLGQDLWVLEKTAYKRNGFFVEFGATDGVLLSNTWLLEKEFGWHGICAEPNPKFFHQLKQNRTCSVSSQYIGRETGVEVEFILAHAYGGSREFASSDNHTEKRSAYADAGNVVTLLAISLNDFLEQHHAPHDIDYLSVDTEGSEYDLLSTFPFEKWNIRLLTIEHNFTDQRDKILHLLAQNGYRRTEHQWDDWYEKVETPRNA